MSSEGFLKYVYSEGLNQPERLPCLIGSFDACQYDLQYQTILNVDSKGPINKDVQSDLGIHCAYA